MAVLRRQTDFHCVPFVRSVLFRYGKADCHSVERNENVGAFTGCWNSCESLHRWENDLRCHAHTFRTKLVDPARARDDLHRYRILGVVHYHPRMPCQRRCSHCLCSIRLWGGTGSLMASRAAALGPTLRLPFNCWRTSAWAFAAGKLTNLRPLEIANRKSYFVTPNHRVFCRTMTILSA